MGPRTLVIRNPSHFLRFQSNDEAVGEETKSGNVPRRARTQIKRTATHRECARGKQFNEEFATSTNPPPPMRLRFYLQHGLIYTESMTADAPANNPIVSQDPDILGGVAVFAGTRVPFGTFIEYLEGGDSLDTFLADFPSVRRELAIEALEWLRQLATGDKGPRASAA